MVFLTFEYPLIGISKYLDADKASNINIIEFRGLFCCTSGYRLVLRIYLKYVLISRILSGFCSHYTLCAPYINNFAKWPRGRPH